MHTHLINLRVILSALKEKEGGMIRIWLRKKISEQKKSIKVTFLRTIHQLMIDHHYVL